MFANLDELSEGGRGIKLMWQIADELSYTRTPNARNCLLIGKNYRKPEVAHLGESKNGGAIEQLKSSLHKNQGVSEGDRQPSCEAPIETIHLQVKSDLTALIQLLKWFDQLEELQIPQDVWFQCKLALAEGFTNAVRYAHQTLPPETPIDVEVTVFPQRLEMRIWDFGQPFDFDAKLKSILEREQERNSQNGYKDSSANVWEF